MIFLEIICSSAVIVALINLVVYNKSSRIQNITQNRADWREDIKDYTAKLNQCNPNEIKDVLTMLKLNLNGFGCYNRKKYPIDERLDFLKDEHIWKTIDIIEEECDKENCSFNKIEKYKQQLIKFMSLLLKFDWERSKEEIKNNYAVAGSVTLFVVCVFSCCIQIFDLKKVAFSIRECLQIFILLSIPYVILWSQYLIERPKILKITKWYKDTEKYAVAWVVSIIFEAIVLYCFEYIYKINIAIAIICGIIAMLIALLYPMSKRSMYLEYEECIVRVMELNTMIIYPLKSGMGWIRAVSFFVQKGLNFQIYDNDTTILDDVSFEKYIKTLEQKDQIKILRWHYRIKYKFDKSNDLMDYIREKPKRCKYIVKYKTKYTIGRNKGEWNQWIQVN